MCRMSRLLSIRSRRWQPLWSTTHARSRPIPFDLGSVACVVAACAGVAATAARADGPATLEVDAGKPGVAIPAGFFGLMTEEINHSYDGGLFAELIQNRTFQDPPPRRPAEARGRARRPGPGVARGGVPIHWSVVGPGKATTDRADPVNAALPVSLKLDLAGDESGVANDGYWGIPVRPDTTYTASFYAKGGGGFAGPVTASLRTDDGNVTVARGETPPVTGAWKKYTVTLRTAHDAPTTSKARFVLSASGHGQRLLQPRLALPADVPGHAERPAAGPDEADGRAAAEVHPPPRRQLPRREPVRRPVQLEADDRPGRPAAGAHGALGLPVVRRVRPAGIPALVQAARRRAGAGPLRRLRAQRRPLQGRQPGDGPLHPGGARGDRVRQRPGRQRVGQEAGGRRVPRAVPAALRRDRQRGLVRPLGQLRRPVHADGPGDPRAVPAPEDHRLRAGQELQARPLRRPLLPQRQPAHADGHDVRPADRRGPAARPSPAAAGTGGSGTGS